MNITRGHRRFYAIGDIHGHYDALMYVLNAIREDGYDASSDHIVFLGDYIDRGPDSARVVEAVRAMTDEGAATALRGNHEQMMVDAYEACPGTPEWDHWWYQGGRETAVSFSNATQRVPADVIKWAGALPHLLSAPAIGYMFVHAGLRPCVGLGEQDPEDLLWIREEFLESDYRFPHVVVHGHTPITEPVERPNRIGIDTVLRTGVITAVRLEEGQSPVFVRHKWSMTS